MTAKEYLSQVNRARLKADLIRRQYKAFMSGVASASVDSVRVDGGKLARDKAEDHVMRGVELHDRLNSAEREYFSLQDELFAKIDALDNMLYVQILTLHYINGKKLADVAEEIGYSYQYIREAHGKALKAFEEKYALRGVD